MQPASARVGMSAEIPGVERLIMAEAMRLIRIHLIGAMSENA